MIQQFVDSVGLAALAGSGAVVGVRKGFDLFGIATLAVLTGVGGGGSLVATVLRLAAITFHWRLPTAPRGLINHVRAHTHPPQDQAG